MEALMFSYKSVSYFSPYKQMVCLMGNNGSKTGNGCAFAFDAKAYLCSAKEIGVILYTESGSIIKIPFSNSGKSGSLYGLCIEDLNPLNVDIHYNFYADDEIIIDKNAKSFTGFENYGEVDINNIKSVFNISNFDWEDDIKPQNKYEDSIYYGLNVRGYTKDKSSHVKHPGTYEGLVEKSEYLTELGITGLVLMPTYEFNECENLFSNTEPPKSIEDAKELAYSSAKICNKINFWGFTEGYYYAPKSSYSANKDSEFSFKTFIKKFHKKKIEIIMQFYFPATIKKQEIIDILKYWVIEYHIDGFRISGFNIPHDSIIGEPVLSNTKLWFTYIPYNEIENYILLDQKYLATDNGNFKNDIRKFLKSDEGLINQFIDYQKRNPEKNSVINYIADYDGFSLNDIYSYERKHNEDNGESNSDGTNENHSWNCGIEGPSRKKNIQLIRIKQIKNALLLLMLSQGTPYIYSGDEFGDSRLGNNNAYCQDNECGHIIWKNNSLSKELLSFTKTVINLRKNNSIFHLNKEMTNMDYMSLGYPDLSYHGIEAWRPELSYNSRMLGMFFNGAYSNDKSNISYYVGINMHWENHRLAIPKFKKGTIINKIIDTGLSENTAKENEIPVSERSIVIYEVIDKK